MDKTRMKVIVAGSRVFTDSWYFQLEEQLKATGWDITEIVSGGARGADRLGEEYAKENDLKLTLFPADWEKHGKAAGYIRNKEMAEYADACFVFWDGRSKGSKHMIDIARAKKLKVEVGRPV